MASKPTSSPSASSPTTSPRERPRIPPLSRHHSRSSSQIATLASLALSPASPTSPRLSSRSTTTSPRSSIYGGNAGSGAMPWSVGEGNVTSTSGSRPTVYRDDGEYSDSDSDSEVDERNGDGGRSRNLSNGTDSTPTTTSSSDHSSSSLPPANRKQMLSERRKTLPAVASPSPLSHLASTASTPSPIPSPDQNPSSASSAFIPFSPNTQSALASLPPTDPSTPAQTSFPNSSIGLAQLIQQKRRQASAPYYNTARTYQQRFVSTPITSNENGGFSVMSGGGTGDATGWNGGWGDTAPIASTSGTISPPLSTVELGQSLPPSRSRSRHGSRRSTTSGRLSLQTSGLHLSLGDSLLIPGSMAIGEGDEGMVMTPTTEEWRSLGGKLSELADLRAKDEERLRLKEEERVALWEKEREERPRKEESTVKRKKNPLRPSLWDVSSDEDDQEDDLGLSLSLSRFTTNGKKKRQTSDSSPSTIPIPTPPPPAPPEASPSNSLENHTIRRPDYQHVPKSSFSYSSTKGGRAGGFVSHSNTSSLSSISTPLATPGEDSLPTISKAPDSEPLPTVETFKPTHRPQKSESSIQLNPATIARPALSRGSLTSATGGLSSPPIVVNQEDKGSCSPPKGLGLPKIPLPPNVYKSLEQGFSSSAAEIGGGTPRSTAPTPSFDHSEREPLATPMTEVQTPYEPPFAPPSPARNELGSIIAAVDLDWTKPLGPVDPRTYSAVTGLRDIRSFIVEQEEAGKGAYGSVRRARERGPSGQPIGPELIIKYVIKQRILADCWKKHKILGPIPIEVHVLDHLRRVPYEPRAHLKYLRSIRERRQSMGGRKRVTSGLTRRSSGQPEVDLWRGGEDGGVVRTGHPNVCGLLDFFEDGEFYYLVMPQATASSSPSSTPTNGPIPRGQDLFDFVDLHPAGLPPKPIARILSQVADALAFLHEHSIVHRDIKDENVVLDPDGNVRLIDFGSAAYIKDGRFFDTFSGTLDFAAPEVLKGARYSGKEQDVWALGVLGYVLICGECPFWSPEEAMHGLAADSRALAQLQLKLPGSSLVVGSPTPSPIDSSDEDGLSLADAVDLVTRCLEIDLTARPSADAVCDHAFLAGDGGWRGRRGWIPVESGEDEVLD